jgi:transposase
MQQKAQNISAEDENGDRVTGEVLQIIEQLPDSPVTLSPFSSSAEIF